MSDTPANNRSTEKGASAARSLRWYLGRPWLRIAILVICGAIARYPALQGQLIWDDDYLVGDNPLIRSPLLILECFRHFLFLDSFATHYRPVQNISYCLDYIVWGGEPLGYHISNLLWHVSGALLLYALLHRLLANLAARSAATAGFDQASGRDWSGAAFLIALLWVVHPVHSAAVDYISGRADSLACVFACGAWLLYLRGRRVNSLFARSAAYCGAASLTLLALGSRESACMWVLLFLLHLFSLERDVRLRAKFAVLGVVLVTVGTYAALRHLPTEHTAVMSDGGSPAVTRVVLMLRALGDYARLMVWPSVLHMERSVEAPGAAFGNAGWRQSIGVEYLSVLGLLVAIGLAYGSWRAGRARSIRAFGAAWFVVSFLPISNLLDLNATVAEHWLYLPSVGLLIFVTGCVMELPLRVRKSAIVVACLATAALTARSFVRSADWLSPETFYRRALATGAAKPRIALNLGVALANKGDYKSAEPLLRRVVKAYPDYPMAVNALAHVLYREGRKEEGNRYFAIASDIAERTRNEYPRTWVAALNVAHMHVREKDLAGAIAIADKARQEYPGTWDLISFESEAVRKLNGPAAALPMVQEFAQANWWHARAAIALGKLYSELGRYSEAEAEFRHAARLDVHGVEGLNLIAQLDIQQNRLDAALTIQRRAVARQPDGPRQHLLLSDILSRMGRTADARAALVHVTQLQAIAQSDTILN